jgi:outer membrane protein assembly factor BamE (lipoprotein component of BamABCDE complex)
MKSIFRLFALAPLFFVSCAAPGPQASLVPVQVGMSMAQVRATYGEPLRIAQCGYQEQEWYYYFGSQRFTSAPIPTKVSTNFNYVVQTSGQESTTVTKMTEKAIRFNSAGYVKAPVPSGSVIHDAVR